MTPKKPMECVVCLAPASSSFCRTCRRSYDTYSFTGGVTVLAAIEWAAKRARRFERQRSRRSR
jgi:hypothetical protein